MTNRHSATPTALTCLLCAVAFAAAFSLLVRPASADDDTADDSDTIEEIVVYGDKSLAQLRREMHKASEAFFDVYNGLNSDDDFDILCDYETRLGVRRRNHVCKPRFALKAEARETSSFMLSGGAVQRTTGPGAGFQPGNGYVTPIRNQVLEKEEAMWQEVADLLAEHPEFQEAYTDLVRARNGYESEKARRNNE